MGSDTCSSKDKSINPVEIFQHLYNSITPYMAMDGKCTELRSQLLNMRSREQRMIAQLEAEATNPCKKQKEYVRIFFKHMKSFRDEALKTLEKYEGGCKWVRIHMLIVQKLDYHLEKGQDLLHKADQLMEEGLTCDEVFTRGLRLPVEKLIGKTANELRSNALVSIRRGDRIIGIHGNLGAGKTNLIKFLHNDIFDDREHFKAVFWARAPQEHQTDVKSIQDCVARAMHFHLEDEDVVRRSGLLAKKFEDMAPGHIVFFLDDVKEPFIACDVGIPVKYNEAAKFCCTLVFTASSEDICNKMHCESKFRINRLSENEAQELFLHVAGCNTHSTRSYVRNMKKRADDMATECAHMPLVITQVARLMTGKEDICEWNHRLNELKGIVEDIHGDEGKILEQLKFNFNCIKDHTIRGCFLDSASVLIEGHQLTRQDLIQYWIRKGRISKKRRRDANPTVIDDRGHTMINELQRMYLLEVVELDGREYVRMNKWIGKMAKKILSEEEEVLR